MNISDAIATVNSRLEVCMDLDPDVELAMNVLAAFEAREGRRAAEEGELLERWCDKDFEPYDPRHDLDHAHDHDHPNHYQWVDGDPDYGPVDDRYCDWCERED